MQAKKNIVLNQKQGEQIVNLLLAHMESSRDLIKHFFIPEATDALEEEVKECKALLDAILPQLTEKEEVTGLPDVASIASDMQKEQCKAVLHCVDVIMKDIADAKKKGEKHCLFSQTIDRLYGMDMDIENDVIHAFDKAGYEFINTGNGLDVCWK